MSFWIGNILGLIAITILAFILISAIRILQEWERAVVFMLGRYWNTKGPGLILIIPVLQTYQRIDLRTQVFDVPVQDVISKDNVSVKVNAVIYYRVVDASKALIQVSNYNNATSQLAQTRLRSILGEHELDEILQERDKLSNELQRILDEQTEAWGVKVANVELKQVDLDEQMIRTMARGAEAERQRRARVIEADGEKQAAQALLEAAHILSTRGEAMQLRYLSTLSSIANDRSSTIVFPMPTNFRDLFRFSEPADDNPDDAGRP